MRCRACDSMTGVIRRKTPDGKDDDLCMECWRVVKNVLLWYQYKEDMLAEISETQVMSSSDALAGLDFLPDYGTIRSVSDDWEYEVPDRNYEDFGVDYDNDNEY